MAQVRSNDRDFRVRNASVLANGSDVDNGSVDPSSKPSWCAQQSTAWLDGMKLAGCVAGGVVFGFAAEKCRGRLLTVCYVHVCVCYV